MTRSTSSPVTRRLPACGVLPVVVLLTCGVVLAAGCDTVEPVAQDQLVVEAFLDAGKALPDVILRRTQPLLVPYAAPAAEGAEVVLSLAGRPIAYAPTDEAGRYAPVAAGTVPAGAAFSLDVQWAGRRAKAEGTIPPPIRLDSVHLAIPDQPVQAILLDSLNLGVGLDSLGVDIGVEQGFIYPITVILWWHPDAAAPDEPYWVQTLLRPLASSPSVFANFFLRPEQILQEQDAPTDAQGRRMWTGVYAVAVDRMADPVPAHSLTVALLRSGPDYARFATSRDAPGSREPISNLTGALGIVAGISVDSLALQVESP